MSDVQICYNQLRNIAQKRAQSHSPCSVTSALSQVALHIIPDPTRQHPRIIYGCFILNQMIFSYNLRCKREINKILNSAMENMQKALELNQ
jgi:hypothetical protein